MFADGHMIQQRTQDFIPVVDATISIHGFWKIWNVRGTDLEKGVVEDWVGSHFKNGTCKEHCEI